MNSRTKQTILSYVLFILLSLIVCLIITLLLVLPKQENAPKEENYKFFSGGIYFDYVDNSPNQHKTLFLISNSDGSFQGVCEYIHTIRIDEKWNRGDYIISKFTLNGQEITIYFDDEVFEPVHGVFNNDWTSVVFSDSFPFAFGDSGWKFDIRKDT